MLITYKPSTAQPIASRWDEAERMYVRLSIRLGAGPLMASEAAQYWRGRSLSEFCREIARLIGEVVR